MHHKLFELTERELETSNIFMYNIGCQVSISSTFYERIFCTNVVSAAFFLVTCTYKKLPKRCLYDKRERIMLMKLTAGFPVYHQTYKKAYIFTCKKFNCYCGEKVSEPMGHNGLKINIA